MEEPAGKYINDGFKSGGGVAEATNDDIDRAMKRLNKLNESSTGYAVADVKKELQTCMQNYFGVFRRGEFMEKGVSELRDIGEKINSLHLTDKSIAFNTSRVEALELQNLLRLQKLLLPYQELYLEQRVGEHMQETTFLIEMMKIGYVIQYMVSKNKKTF